MESSSIVAHFDVVSHVLSGLLTGWMQALSKLTTAVDGRQRIISDPPLIVPVEELFTDLQADAIYAQLNEVLASYLHTLQSDRRHLVEQFT